MRETSQKPQENQSLKTSKVGCMSKSDPIIAIQPLIIADHEKMPSLDKK